MDGQLVSNMEKLERLFSSRMCDYEEKLKKVAAGTGSPHPDIASLSREFSEFKSFVWETLSTMKSQIDLITLGLDRHETAMRRKILLFHGITEKQNEKLHAVVHKVINNQLKLPDVMLDHLQVCHRLGSSRGKTRPVLVRFVGMEQRNLVWDTKTALKGTGITVSEFLTKPRHKAFVAARQHFGIKQCWSVEGKITILLPNKSKKKIESMSELTQLMSQFPSVSGSEIAEDVQNQTVINTNASKASADPPRTRRR